MQEPFIFELWTILFFRRIAEVADNIRLRVGSLDIESSLGVT